VKSKKYHGQLARDSLISDLENKNLSAFERSEILTAFDFQLIRK